MKVNVLAMAALALIGSGCSPTGALNFGWRKPGANEAQFRQDAYACDPGPGPAPVMQRSTYLGACLKEKGWLDDAGAAGYAVTLSQDHAQPPPATPPPAHASSPSPTASSPHVEEIDFAAAQRHEAAAIAVWKKCLSHATAALATTSSEPSAAIVAAAFGVCKPAEQEVRIASVDLIGKISEADAIVDGAKSSLAEDLSALVLTKRASSPSNHL